MKTNIIKLVFLLLSFGMVEAEVNDKRIVSCVTEDGSTEVYLKRSTPADPVRSIWVKYKGNKEKIWEGRRKPGLSIATNRIPVDQAGNEPDPYEAMKIVRAAFNEKVLVVIFKTRLNKEVIDPNNSAYAGGFFFDQIIRTKSLFGPQVFNLPPHSDYSWSEKNNFRGFQAPWYKEHDGYEYFLRSFVKNSKGKWVVHVSAALSVLWADSLGLPISSLAIEDENTYAVTFSGKYKYYTINAKKQLDDLYASTLKGTGYEIALFDFYGGIEKLIYKGEATSGETVERIKYVPFVSKNGMQDDRYFQSVYTTLHGGNRFYRIAYDKDYWRGINSWVKYDELTIEQVFRTDPPIKDGNVPLLLSHYKIGYGCLPRGYQPLAFDEVRQTYCLNIQKAKPQLTKGIAFFSKYSSNDKVMDSRMKRLQLYMRLIDEELENELRNANKQTSK